MKGEECEACILAKKEKNKILKLSENTPDSPVMVVASIEEEREQNCTCNKDKERKQDD